MAKNIIKKQYLVEISVDADEIANKYPNYPWNYNSPQEFIEARATDLKFVADMDMSRVKEFNKWGYGIKIIPYTHIDNTTDI